MLTAGVLAGLLTLWVAVPAGATGSAGPVPAPRGRRPRPGDLDLARMLERLAAVLGTGAGLRAAWGAVAASLPAGDLAELARAAAAGSDPTRGAPARLRGEAAVRALGAALRVCDRTGAPTVRVLTALAEALRDLHAAAGARRTAFAGPRSTARILLVLPLAGLGLGMLLGGDPLGVLGGSVPGRVLGAIGLLLTVTGWWWMRHQVRAADPPPGPGIDPSVQLDLVAGALDAGLSLAAAVDSVARALDPGPDRDALDHLGAALRAGVPATTAGAALPPALRGLAEGAVLTEISGADLGGILRATARDLRHERARTAQEAAARLAVSLVLPTGVTLLPAFVALGIVPTVVSLLGGTLALVAP